ncbi:polyphosphate kinase 1 [Flavobacterium sp. xlx-214]|uniref:polyphosphate kinase 1 n=1 Tax=unclassified Flavobacterium TaxID=196869 RepID=UPI0013D8CE01|nr:MULTISPECIES: polyphosphate kinase 1 [unclassified Flavobacterium]MBA5793525.1 polyphosphate kinase 1 [Flavobacterium sp. xlx-221]QMI82705.1 polyphosphate kinase 1 [Flavobacterium sp. xlx-214]
MQLGHNRYIDREKSWLAFNERVLQEAADHTVPLLDRLRFLGIFSNNLDEFFRVRYAAIRRISISKNGNKKLVNGVNAKSLLQEITNIVIKLQAKSLEILTEIEHELEGEGIFILNEKQLDEEQRKYIQEFFIHKVSPVLVTIVLNDLSEFPHLRDSYGYLAVKLVKKDSEEGTKSIRKRTRYALIEMPSQINRFVELPEKNGNQYIMLLDDVIRFNLDYIFSIFDFESISAHMIKITRDAELDFDSDLHKSFLEKISNSVRDRRVGEVVRFVYDSEIEKDTLDFFLDKMDIESVDSIIPGGRYHNRRDYMNFPNLGRNDLTAGKVQPLPVSGLSLQGSIIQQIKHRDFLVHTPFQSFNYLVKFLREAALDPKVTSIKITLYRLAKNSQIISSLINAAKNGKQVTVQIELQARFDETSNINYAEIMQAEGIKLIFGVKGLKVHSKICVVERMENKKIKRYGFVSTGNFNESTSAIYTDVTLLTSNSGIMKEVRKVFEFFEVNYKIYRYKDLIVSPHYTRNKFVKLIDNEIEKALNDKPAMIRLKMNSLSDYKMIDKLYDASRAGVKVQLIVRGICCLIPGIPGMSDNIEAISIVDNLLEHSRIYIFGVDKEAQVYISSADFMTRNIDERVEVTCPIYDDAIKNELIETFHIYWNGNVKIRLHSERLENRYKRTGTERFRAQEEIYNYYRNKIDVILD